MCRKIPVPVVRAIQARHSVRTFMPRPLTPQDRARLAAYMEQLDNPFGVPVKVYMLDRQVAPVGEKLGTYGIIQGAGTFLGVSVPDTEMVPVAAGYAFENLILEATAMGLGTVWLAATFNRAGFASAMGVPADALFPAISPVGYPAVRRRLTESLMRAAMRSSARKRWRELFYEHDFQTPLAELAAGAYAVPLEMLRLAPSDKNTQPWRVLKVGSRYHFYVTHRPGVAREERIIKQVDAGIALSHFHQTVLELGLKGSFEHRPPVEVACPDNMYYVVSWKMEE